IDLQAITFDPEVYQLVPVRILQAKKMIPLNIQNGLLTLACVQIDDLAGVDEIRRLIRGVEVKPISVSDQEYRRFLEVNAAKIGGAKGGPVKGTVRSKLQPVNWLSEEREQ